MKKIFNGLVVFTIVAISFTGCLNDDNGVSNIKYAYAPIDSIVVGEIMPQNKITNITTYYSRENTCQNFYTYDYFRNGDERTVYLVLAEYLNNSEDCIDEDEALVNESTLKFKPELSGTYTFRFWNGTNEAGDDVFIETEVEIPNNL